MPVPPVSRRVVKKASKIFSRLGAEIGSPSLVTVRRIVFASLAVRNYRLYFYGQSISVAGTWMQNVALAWLILQISHSGTVLGLFTGLRFLPLLLFAVTVSALGAVNVGAAEAMAAVAALVPLAVCKLSERLVVATTRMKAPTSEGRTR